MGIENYRRPDEIKELDETADRINAVIAGVCRDLELMHISINLGEPEHVVERWIDNVYEPLRSMSRSDLAYAIVMLVDKQPRRNASLVFDDLADL